MGKKKKLLTMLALVLACCLMLVGCGSSNLSYYDQMTEGKDYNRKLFYQNDLEELAADPSVIFVTTGEEKGYYYMYGTSDQIGASGYMSWRSKDLSRWECMGVAFLPDRDSWARQNYWAPEVIYYQSPAEKEAAVDGKYYMVYNAWNINKSNLHCIGLAVSDNPFGPFIQYTGTNSDDRTLTINDAYLDADLFAENSGVKGKPFIDASPYVDDNGKLYLYVTLDIQMGEINSSIWGMELKDMFTPDYASVKQLTEFDKNSVGGTVFMGETNKTNEAPFMYKANGKYYLTYSISQYFSADYSVAQAVADSPLGNFVKIDHKKGGKLLTYSGNTTEDYEDYSYDHMSGTGHHSFIRVGDELFIAYHAFVDRSAGTIAMGRAIAVDRVFMANNGEQEILYVNGPSYSLQPLPFATSGYENIAKYATIEATKAKNDVKYLNDGLYKNHNYNFINEFEVDGNQTKITLKFDKTYKARAIMIYNAFKYENSFASIKEIVIKTKSEINGSKIGNAIINNLGFNKQHIFVDRNDESFKLMRPGGAAIAEFDELEMDEIVITIEGLNKKSNLNISDIVILGKGV